MMSVDGWVLHCGTMKRAMLYDEHAAVYSHNFSVRESKGELPYSFCVFLWLVVGWHEHSIINDEKVCMGCRKPFSFVVATSVRQREWVERVGCSIFCAQGFQFIFHGLKFR